jgi:hypothetical protein
LQQFHLAQPLVPPPNGNRRRIEIHSTSDDFDSEDSEWTSENEGEPKEDEEEEEKGSDEGDEDDEEEGGDGGGQLSQAAKEAQRQREFFTKLPPRSYSNLGERTRSGLLTNLFKPDPSLFPEGHPYRTSKSHHDLVSKVLAPAQGVLLYGMGGGTFGKRRSPISPPPPSVKLATSKSAAALPEMVNINAAALSGSLPRYRPRAAPKEVDVSDSGDEENPDNGLQMSKSVAQKRLEALVGQRNSNLSKVDDVAAPSSGSTQSNSEAQITIQPRTKPVMRVRFFSVSH